ncbi:MAG: Crotonobetainyl-CoA:carnitine CoA-transferase CaiB [Chloroflexi bacterium]|jgi:crotonobetainyl-CoA:carnitine CoA-transferase CaiB-like acyl-CoA transferase|nr:MAG: Crotonobetainyl-CoA:carnitine CoA-transferase CaiB [Chloroflexota bacterium]
MTQVQAETISKPKALAGIRVLDFTWVRAGPWGCRWLGTLGAEVIKIEWPQTPDMIRNPGIGTLKGVEPSLNSNYMFNDTNANKLGITLNLRSTKGLELVKRLIAVSDIVVENYSSRVLHDWGLPYEEMSRINPGIIYVSQAGFGHTGRNHHYQTMGPVAQALSGLTHLSGLPGEEPAGWGWSYLDDTGGMYTAMAALTALNHRNMTGMGQHVDLSQMMLGIPLNGSSLLDLTINNRSLSREGFPPGNRAHWPGTPLLNNYRGATVAPHNTYRTKGGGYYDWCTIACFSDQEWGNLVGLMGCPAWALDGKFAALSGRLQHQEELDMGIEGWTVTMERYELMERCQASGVRAMPVQSNKDRVENDPQLGHRGMYTELEHPILGRHKFQNAPFKLSESPALNHMPAPMIGQHNREVFEGLLGLSHEELTAGYEDGTFWPPSVDRYAYVEAIIQAGPLKPGEGQQLAPASVSGARQGSPVSTEHGPLAGLRVLELSDEKGQWAGKLMADLDADLIKIEPPGGETTRTVGPFYEDLPHRERSLSFWHYNTSKRGITLNIESEDGRRLFRRMAEKADVILETFKPGYMTSLGLGYDDLKKDNPGLIMCSLTPFGQTGPWKDFITSDLVQLAAGGQMGCCGYNEADVADVADPPPIAGGGGQAWHMGCHYAYIGIMSALNYRNVTGKGQYIDASVHEACALTTEMHVITYIYTGDEVRRNTGRHSSSPNGFNQLKSQLRCVDGKYVNASIAPIRLTPQQLRSLAEWMDGYGMAGDMMDDKYMDVQVIRESGTHIHQLFVEFVASRTQDEVYHGGQERGFTWGAIRSPDVLVDDEHLHDRGFWTPVEHPELGRSFTYPGPAGIYNGSPWHISRRAPLIGEHNEEVICEELGLSRAELVVLAENGVV